MPTILVTHSKGGTGKSTLSLALSDLLEGSQLVDLDPQQTLKATMEISGRKKVFGSLEEADQSKTIIIDTPPYRTSKTENLIESADIVLIPCCEGINDLVAATRTAEVLADKNALKKSYLVFTRIRLPISNTFKEIKNIFKERMPEINILDEMMSERIAYKRLAMEEIQGKAKEEMKQILNKITNV